MKNISIFYLVALMPASCIQSKSKIEAKVGIPIQQL